MRRFGGFCGLLWCWLAGAALPVSAQTVTDGDTIKLAGTIYRLWGIDAPESKQACADGWMGGQAAKTALQGLLTGAVVECEAKTTDRYGRTVGLCRANGADVQAVMVRQGMAWAFVRYSRDYVDQEAAARADRLGIWAHGCQPAWEWRAERR